MFPTTSQIREYSIDKIIFDPGAGKAGVLKPELRKFDFDLSSFPEKLASTLAILQRPYLLFGASSGFVVSGLPDATFTFNFPIHALTGNPEKPFAQEKSLVEIDAFKDDATTHLLVTFRENKEAVKLLDQIKQDKNGIPACGNSLVERAKACDIAEHNGSRSLTPFLDPPEYKLINDLHNLNVIHFNNAEFATGYFMQMASLFLTGTFHDRINYRIMTGIKGIEPDGKVTPIFANMLHTAKRQDTLNLRLPESFITNFQDFLAQDPAWYERNSLLQRDLYLSEIIKQLYNLGDAFLNGPAQGSMATRASDATQAITDELCTNITGEQPKNSENLSDRLRKIGKRTGTEELINTYIDIFLGNNGIGAGIFRNGSTHAAIRSEREMDEKFGYNGIIDYWGALFYRDLTKSLISIVMGRPTGFFDFDDYATNARLTASYQEKNRVAFVPKDKLIRFGNMKLPDTTLYFGNK